MFGVFERMITGMGNLVRFRERDVHPSGRIAGLRGAASLCAGGLLASMGVVEPSLAPVPTLLGVSMIVAGPLSVVYEFIRARREGRLPDSLPEEV